MLNGTTTPIAVNAATNQLTNAYYDANGNMTSGAGATLGYDEANRVVSATVVSGGQQNYGYDPANKRVYQLEAYPEEWFTFYGAKGEKLGVYEIQGPWLCAAWGINNTGYPPCVPALAPLTTSVWFAGRLILDSGNSAVQDRLGSNGSYLPYGETVTASAGDDRVMFATYLRDSYTGLDYADQRFYASTYGRFNTPDPYVAGGAASGSVSNPNDPGSWNRYAYTGGDPVNRFDPNGTDYCDATNINTFVDGLYLSSTGCGNWGGGLAGYFQDIGSIISSSISNAVAAAQTLSLTSCEVELFTRPVANTLGLGTHSYLEVWGSSGVENTLEGGPTNNSKLFPGLLKSFDTLDGFAFPDDVPATPQGGLNPISCGQAAAVIQDDLNFKTNSTYNLLGPNSNSFLNWLITTGGLSSIYPNAPPGSVGWNTPVQPVSNVPPGKGGPPRLPRGPVAPF